jgi:hypothetical protein
MSTRERPYEEKDSPGQDPPAGPPAPTGRLRAEGQEHLARGSEIIRRALSGYRQGFLEACRQEGGQ